MEIVLEAKHLTKAYKLKTALQDVSFRVERGKIYGFIGNNGAGKTTLLRVAMGLSHPTSGEIALFGQTKKRALEKARRRVGSLIDAPIFYENMTAVQNLRILRLLKGVPDEDDIPRVLELAGLDLQTAKRQHMRHYSMGMKQRYGIAAALLGRPELLLLDEPINGLDPSGIREMRTLLQRLCREEGVTILLSSHILAELYQLATDYIFIDHGRILEQISHETLNDRCQRQILLTVADPNEAAVVLEEQLHLTEYKVLPNDQIQILNCHQQPEKLSKSLQEHGVTVLTASALGMTLEEYFLALTGGGGRV